MLKAKKEQLHMPTGSFADFAQGIGGGDRPTGEALLPGRSKFRKAALAPPAPKLEQREGWTEPVVGRRCGQFYAQWFTWPRQVQGVVLRCFRRRRAW